MPNSWRILTRARQSVIGSDMQVKSSSFRTTATEALLDEDLRAAMGRAEGGFVDTRKRAVDELVNFQEYREFARNTKNHVLSHLDYYLTRFESSVMASGGQVHWASNGEEVNRIVLDICRRPGINKITKGKSMVSEEFSLNAGLEAAGLEVVETDLGEYIIQLAEETPSHIIAPAVHKTKQAVTDLFEEHHREAGYPRVVEHLDIVNQARQVLRDHFCTADVGITGGNFLIADTGSIALITNEGNGDLTANLPDIHIVVTSIEKVIPDMQALGGFLRLLGRSATGQIMSVYTTLFNGPRRVDDLDGPGEFHVVLVDNGRSGILGSQFQDILRCIKCGACMNHCPVYTSIGGHAYGWVYPGPMGSVLTPLMVGQKNAPDLPYACTLNGHCKTVCPVMIPLPDLLREHRNNLVEVGQAGSLQKWGMQLWFQVARNPLLYNMMVGLYALKLNMLARLTSAFRRGSFKRIPLLGAWTSTRDFPVPQTTTFQAQWKRRRRHD